jgi:hypothetical protein
MNTVQTIKIGERVWNAIKTEGKFGETADDVLRRLLKLDDSDEARAQGSADEGERRWKERRAKVRMTQKIENGELVLRFDSGQTGRWKLPANKDDHAENRRVRDMAVAFVQKNGGTIGQEHAAMRALTHRGYHVTAKLSRDELRQMFI